MDKATYEKKLTLYKLSDATVQRKQKAIEALNMQYYGTTTHKMRDILNSITQSQAELKAEEYTA